MTPGADCQRLYRERPAYGASLGRHRKRMINPDNGTLELFRRSGLRTT